MFQGLTAQQGDQIASYIRSLNTPAPAAARPWNPPYQPGPGLDSKPVTEWSAGAGLSGVLESDAGMIPYLMPGGSTAGWAPTSNLSAREIPITLQLPDWNRWLPTVHPLDAWGDRFTSSVLFANYLIIRSQLRFQDPQSYINVQVPMGYWVTRDHEFLAPLTRPQDDPKWNDPSYVGAIYSTRLWSVVKWWELNQEFGLEGIAKAVFGPQADSRAWNTNTLFFASPNMSGIPDPSVGIGNGTRNAWEYFAFMWYELQMLLNNGNGRFVGTYPIDYPYCYPSMQNLCFHSPVTPQPGHGALMTLWLVKALQGSEPGAGPE